MDSDTKAYEIFPDTLYYCCLFLFHVCRENDDEMKMLNSKLSNVISNAYNLPHQEKSNNVVKFQYEQDTTKKLLIVKKLNDMGFVESEFLKDSNDSIYILIINDSFQREELRLKVNNVDGSREVMEFANGYIMSYSYNITKGDKLIFYSKTWDLGGNYLNGSKIVMVNKNDNWLVIENYELDPSKWPYNF